jgi:hypothetical protein
MALASVVLFETGNIPAMNPGGIVDGISIHIAIDSTP